MSSSCKSCAFAQFNGGQFGICTAYTDSLGFLPVVHNSELCPAWSVFKPEKFKKIELKIDQYIPKTIEYEYEDVKEEKDIIISKATKRTSKKAKSVKIAEELPTKTKSVQDILTDEGL